MRFLIVDPLRRVFAMAAMLAAASDAGGGGATALAEAGKGEGNPGDGPSPWELETFGERKPVESKPAGSKIKLGEKEFEVPDEVANALNAARGTQSNGDRVAAENTRLNGEIAKLQGQLAQLTQQVSGMGAPKGSEGPKKEAPDARALAGKISKLEAELETPGQLGEVLGEYQAVIEHTLVEKFEKEYLEPLAAVIEQLQQQVSGVTQSTQATRQREAVAGYIQQKGMTGKIDVDKVLESVKGKMAEGMKWGDAVYDAIFDESVKVWNKGGEGEEGTEGAEPRRAVPGGSSARGGVGSAPQGGGVRVEEEPVGDYNAHALNRLLGRK